MEQNKKAVSGKAPQRCSLKMTRRRKTMHKNSEKCFSLASDGLPAAPTSSSNQKGNTDITVWIKMFLSSGLNFSVNVWRWRKRGRFSDAFEPAVDQLIGGKFKNRRSRSRRWSGRGAAKWRRACSLEAGTAVRGWHRTRRHQRSAETDWKDVYVSKLKMK